MLRIGSSHPLFFAKIVWVGVVFMPALFLNFALVFPKERKVDLKYTVLLYAPAILLLGSLLTDLLVQDVRRVFWGTTIVLGRIAPLYGAYTLIYVAAAYYIFFEFYFKSKSRIEKEQFKYIFFGTIVMFFLMFTTNFINLLLKTDILPIGDVSSIFMSALVGYAIIKYRVPAVEPVMECGQYIKPIEGASELKVGRTYIIKEGEERSLKIFVNAITRCSEGLCITKHDPATIREKYSLSKTPILSFSKKAGDDYIDPTKLEELEVIIRRFIEKAKDGIILIDDLGYLIRKNSYDRVKTLTFNLSEDVCSAKARLLLSASRDIPDEKVRELQNLMIVLYTDMLIKILSHPLRKNTINYLNSKKKASFTEIMHALDAKNPQLLNFHLNQLKKYNMVEQDENKVYRLSDNGELAVETINKIENIISDRISRETLF
jgi:DNA-binding HxlR family transcriptional regulator